MTADLSIERITHAQAIYPVPAYQLGLPTPYPGYEEKGPTEPVDDAWRARLTEIGPEKFYRLATPTGEGHNAIVELPRQIGNPDGLPDCDFLVTISGDGDAR